MQIDSGLANENLPREPAVQLELAAELDCLDGVLKLVEVRIMGKVSIW